MGGLYNAPLTYFQIHAPLLLQETAEGHAVRLVYMCTALADVAASTGDERLLEVCRKIWRNIVDKRMFITGGVGSTVNGTMNEKTSNSDSKLIARSYKVLENSF